MGVSSHLSLVSLPPDDARRLEPHIVETVVESPRSPHRRPLDPLAKEALSVVGGGALGGVVGWAIGWPVGWFGFWLITQSWRCGCGRVRHGRCDSWRYA